MEYAFELRVEKEKSRLSLKEDGREVSSREWAEGRDMGRQLFESIDAILKERGLDPCDVGDFEVETDVSDAFTSVKIAQTVAETYRFSVKR
jgi:hypothetical protein